MCALPCERAVSSIPCIVTVRYQHTVFAWLRVTTALQTTVIGMRHLHGNTVLALPLNALRTNKQAAFYGAEQTMGQVVPAALLEQSSEAAPATAACGAAERGVKQHHTQHKDAPVRHALATTDCQAQAHVISHWLARGAITCAKQTKNKPAQTLAPQATKPSGLQCRRQAGDASTRGMHLTT